MEEESRIRYRVRNTVIAVAILAAALGWEFGVKGTLAKRQAWEGSIVRTYRTYDWLRFTSGRHQPDSRRYNHYWDVNCADGRMRSVEVPSGLWRTGRAGDHVVKTAGERWPLLDTPEGRKQLDAAGLLYDAIAK